MATILLAWELGGGLGHLMQLRPLAEGLVQRGHRVYAALKDLSHAKSVFGDSVVLLQAPLRTRKVPDRFRPPKTFAHILYGIGFDDAQELRALGEAWRHLYEFVRPDVIVFDHSPTAMLASRGFPARRIVIGSGFCCPPDTRPMPNLRPWIESDPDLLRQDEDGVVVHANQALHAWGQPPLQRLGQLYSEVNDTFLVTFKELDHYPHRGPAQYRGAWTQGGGKEPQWPQGPGRRIYGYLKPFPGLPGFLKFLTRLGQPTVVVVDGIPQDAQARFTSATLRVESQMLDLNQVSRQCDLAILNGGHGVTVSMLMAGKPIFQLPLYLEQGLMARAITRLGAGLDALHKRPDQVMQRFQMMLHNDRYRAAAEAFASRYRGFDAAQAIQAMVARIEELAQR